MGIRERMNSSKGWGLVAGATLVIIGLAAVTYQAGSGGDSSSAARAPRAGDGYFSTDDGKTWFAESADRIAPFDYKGKTAVRVYVYKCDGKEFVAYLERYTPEGQKAQTTLDEAARQAKSNPAAARINPRDVQVAASGREVKAPGDAAWVPAFGLAGGKIASVKCPNGKGNPEPVQP